MQDDKKKFNYGDVVRLNSGSPPMTVESIGVGGELICVWFDGATRCTGKFYEDSLKKTKPD